jgi:hypothetical protein
MALSLSEKNPRSRYHGNPSRTGKRPGWSERRNIHIDYRYAPAGAQVEAIAGMFASGTSQTLDAID